MTALHTLVKQRDRSVPPGYLIFWERSPGSYSQGLTRIYIHGFTNLPKSCVLVLAIFKSMVWCEELLHLGTSPDVRTSQPVGVKPHRFNPRWGYFRESPGDGQDPRNSSKRAQKAMFFIAPPPNIIEFPIVFLSEKPKENQSFSFPKTNKNL